MGNINKTEFDENFKNYLKLEGEAAERYFNKAIYNDLKAIISNVTYNYQFTEAFLYDDLEQELLIHFLLKKDYIKSNYSNSKKFYNLLFSIFSRKFIDLLRSKKSKDARIEKFIAMYQKVISENEELLIQEDEVLTGY